MTGPIKARADALPEGSSFAIKGQGVMKRTQSGQILGHFTVVVPPGDGFEMPITVIAATERLAFVQIAAFAKRFEKLDKTQVKQSYKRMEAVGWMLSGSVETRKNSISVSLPVHDENRKIQEHRRFKIKGADLEAIAFFTRLYSKSNDNLAEVQKKPQVTRAQALGRNSEVREIFGGCVSGADRDPGKIAEFLDKPEFNEVFPGLRHELWTEMSQDDQHLENTMSYGDMMVSMVNKYSDHQEGVQANVKHLLAEPGMTDGEIADALVHTNASSENCSFNLFLLAYKHRENPEGLKKLYPSG
jgi:hypothetical protein